MSMCRNQLARPFTDVDFRRGLSTRATCGFAFASRRVGIWSCADTQGSLGRSSLHGVGDGRRHELVDRCRGRWAGVAVGEQEMPATDQGEGE